MSRETMLVVEDDEALGRMLKAVLSMKGYRVLCARSGPEALVAAQAEGSIIDLIIADILLDNEFGTALAGELRRLIPSIKVLFMSGYPLCNLADRGYLDLNYMDERTNFFIQKPFLPQTFAAKVESVLSGQALRGAGQAERSLSHVTSAY